VRESTLWFAVALLCGGLAAVPTRSIEDFRLPAKSIFDASMPRYPNVWFYVDASLAPRHHVSFEDATLRSIVEEFRKSGEPPRNRTESPQIKRCPGHERN
jgi:hypothetical protein